MSVIVELEDGKKCAFPVVADDTRRSFYRLVGATTSHQFSNKDLTDPSNNLGVQSATPFTVSADSRFRGRFQTIQAAIDAAAAVAGPAGRKIVQVAPGNYTEIVTLAPYVDLVGCGAATVLRGFFSFSAAGGTSVKDMNINSAGAAFIHTGGELTFFNCTMFSAAPSVVNNSGSVLTLTDCIIDGAAQDILVISAAATTTITRGTIGSDTVGRRISSNAGATKITHSVVQCRLLITGGSCYAEFTRFEGGDEPRAELVAGVLEAHHCTFSSPPSSQPAIIGTGNMVSDENIFSGRTVIAAEIVVRHREDPSTSGSYTPVVSGDHIAEVLAATGLYSRVGNIVHVNVSLTFTSVGGTGTFSFDMTAPLSHGNFIAADDAIGSILWGGGNIHLDTHVRAKTGAHIRARPGTPLLTVGNIRNPNGTTTFSGSFSYILR